MTSPHDAARALLAHAGVEPSSSADAVAGAAVRMWGEIGGLFTRLIGDTTVSAFQARCVSSVGEQLPWLVPPANGSDMMLLQRAFAAQPEEAVAGLALLMAAFFALLGRFIGDVLVRRLLHEAWPGVFPAVSKEQT